jgi:mono/diheme cytochrome c family protein
MKPYLIVVPLGALIAGAITASSSLSVSAQDTINALLMADGGEIYEDNCVGCHGSDGGGGAGPPLAGAAILSSGRAIAAQILNGNEEHGMPPFLDVLDNDEIAAVGTYIRNSWGNAFGIMAAETVATQRPTE